MTGLPNTFWRFALSFQKKKRARAQSSCFLFNCRNIIITRRFTPILQRICRRSLPLEFFTFCGAPSGRLGSFCVLFFSSATVISTSNTSVLGIGTQAELISPFSTQISHGNIIEAVSCYFCRIFQ